MLAKGYGNADYAQRPNTPDTLFEIASTSKQFTAAAILKLSMEGKLKVTDPLKKFFPAAPMAVGAITVHQVLTHTSGISPRIGIPYNSRMTRKQAVAHHLSKPLAFDPGEKFGYSNAGYMVLAAIVEVASGTSFEEYSRERLFEPAGLKDTGFVADKHLDRERMTARLAKHGLAGTAADWHWGWGYRGMGGVVTTANDLRRWDVALRGDAILDKKHKAIFYKPALQAYACGWRVGTTAKGGRKVEHSGGVMGYACNYVRHLDEDVVVVVLSNGKVNPYTASKAIEDHLFPPPKIRAHIDVSPYKLSKHRAAEFDGNATWRVKKTKGAFEFVLEDKVSRHKIIRLTIPAGAARKLLKDLERQITGKRAWGKEHQMHAGAYLLNYRLENGKLTIEDGLELRLMPRYVGMAEGGRRVVDERVLLVVMDRKRSFWPVMAKMDKATARELRKALMTPE